LSSRDYRGRRVVLWPVNIDSTATLREGRKIPSSKGVPKPTIEEIVRAARELGLNPVVEDKAYPRDWYGQRKRVAVDKKGSKRWTLEMIAEAVRALRERRRR
jgi:signal recognition particle subunit SRP19